MRISKFLTISSLVTLFSILYVYQQTEIFHLAYLGQKKSVSFNDLIDKNAVLRYNIQRKSSLTVIGSKISQYDSFEIPDNYQVVRLYPQEELILANQPVYNKESVLSRIFSVKREAQARTISPSTTRKINSGQARAANP